MVEAAAGQAAAPRGSGPSRGDPPAPNVTLGHPRKMYPFSLQLTPRIGSLALVAGLHRSSYSLTEPDEPDAGRDRLLGSRRHKLRRGAGRRSRRSDSGCRRRAERRQQRRGPAADGAAPPRVLRGRIHTVGSSSKTGCRSASAANVATSSSGCASKNGLVTFTSRTYWRRIGACSSGGRTGSDSRRSEPIPPRECLLASVATVGLDRATTASSTQSDKGSPVT